VKLCNKDSHQGYVDPLGSELFCHKLPACSDQTAIKAGAGSYSGWKDCDEIGLSDPDWRILEAYSLEAHARNRGDVAAARPIATIHETCFLLEGEFGNEIIRSSNRIFERACTYCIRIVSQTSAPLKDM